MILCNAYSIQYNNNNTNIIEHDRRCPDIRERCSRGCPLSRNESGCLVCRCEEPGIVKIHIVVHNYCDFTLVANSCDLVH